MAIAEGSGGGGGKPLTDEQVKQVVDRTYTAGSWNRQVKQRWQQAIRNAQRTNYGGASIPLSSSRSPVPRTPAPAPATVSNANTATGARIGQTVNSVWQSALSGLREFANDGSASRASFDAQVDNTQRWQLPSAARPGGPNNIPDMSPVRPQDYSYLGGERQEVVTRQPPTKDQERVVRLPNGQPSEVWTPQQRQQIMDEERERQTREQAIQTSIYQTSLPVQTARENKLLKENILMTPALYSNLLAGVDPAGSSLAVPAEFVSQEIDYRKRQMRIEAAETIAEGGDPKTFLTGLFKTVLAPLNVPEGAKGMRDVQREVTEELRQQSGEEGLLNRFITASDTAAILATSYLEAFARGTVGATIDTKGTTPGMLVGAATDDLVSDIARWQEQGLQTAIGGPQDTTSAADFMERQRQALVTTDSELLDNVNNAFDAMVNVAGTITTEEGIVLAGPRERLAYNSVEELKASPLYDTYRQAADEAALFARYNTPSGPEATQEFIQLSINKAIMPDMLRQEAERYSQLATNQLSPLSSDDKRAASQVSAQLAVVAHTYQDMTYYDMFTRTVNPWADAVAMILFDPLNAVDAVAGLLGKTAKGFRVGRAIENMQPIEPVALAAYKGRHAKKGTLVADDLASAVVPARTIAEESLQTPFASQLKVSDDVVKRANAGDKAAQELMKKAQAVVAADTQKGEELLRTYAKEAFGEASKNVPDKRQTAAVKLAAVAFNQRTAESLGVRAADVANSILGYLSFGINNTKDFRNVVEQFIKDPTVLAEKGVRMVDDPSALRKWDAKMLFGDEADEVRYAWMRMGQDLLDGIQDDYSLGQVSRALEDAALTGTYRRLGNEIELSADVPVFADSVRRKGKRGIEVLDEAENVIKTIKLPKGVEMEDALRGINRMISNTTFRGDANPVRQFGRTMRAIASSFYIIGNISTIVSNSMGASMHLMADNVFSLVNRENALENMVRLAGAADPSYRVGREVGTSGQYLVGEVSRRGRKGMRTHPIAQVAEAFSIPQQVVDAFAKYGDAARSVYSDKAEIPLGNGKSWAVSEMDNVIRVMNNVASDTVKREWRKKSGDIRQALNSIAVPPELQDDIMSILHDAPVIGYDEVRNRAAKLISGATDNELAIGLSALGKENVSSLTPQAQAEVGRILGRGGDSMLEDAVRIIQDDMLFLSHSTLDVDAVRSRQTFTYDNTNQTVHNILDSLRQYGGNAGMSRIAIDSEYSPLAQRLIMQQDSASKVLTRLPNSDDAFRVGIDILNRIETSRIQAHNAVQEIFEKAPPRTRAEWANYTHQVGGVWKTYADDMDTYLGSIGSQITSLNAGVDTLNTVPTPSMWDRLEQMIDLDALEAAAQARKGTGETVGPAVEGGKINLSYKALKEANQLYADWFGQAMRAEFLRAPTADAFDIVTDTYKATHEWGMKAAAVIDDLRIKLMNKGITLDEYYKARDITWRELGDNVAMEFALGAHNIRENDFVVKLRNSGALDTLNPTEQAAKLKTMVDELRQESATLFDRPFRPLIPVSGDLPGIYQDAVVYLGFPDAGQNPAGFNAALQNFVRSSKVEAVALDYGIEITDGMKRMIQPTDLQADDVQNLHRLMASYAFETSNNIPAAWKYVKDLVKDDMAQKRVGNPFGQQPNQMFPFAQPGSDLIEEYNRWTAVRQNTIDGYDPNVTDIVMWRINRMEDAIKNLTGEVNAKQMRRQAKQAEDIDPAMRESLLGMLSGEWQDEFARVARAGLDAGREMSSFTMINHAGNGRYWDDFIALVAPYHFFFTRSAKNMFERTMRTPGRISMLTTMNDAEQRAIDQQRLGDPNLPPSINEDELGQDIWRFRSGMHRYMPFVPNSLINEWSDPRKEVSVVNRILATVSHYGIGTYSPVANTLKAVQSGDPGDLDVVGWTPQTMAAMQAAMAMGLDGKVMDWARDQTPDWVWKAVARDMMFNGESAETMWKVYEEMYQIQNRGTEYLEGWDKEESRALYRQAEQEWAQDRLWGVLQNLFVPFRMEKVPMTEDSVWDMTMFRRYTYQDEEYNPFGSWLGKNTYDKLYPELRAFGNASRILDTSDTPARPISDDMSTVEKLRAEMSYTYTQPGVEVYKLYRATEEDALYAQKDAEMDALRERLGDDFDPFKAYDEVKKINDKYWNDDGDGLIQQLDEQYPQIPDYGEGYNKYAWYNENETAWSVLMDATAKVMEDFPLPERPKPPGEWIPRDEYFAYKEERDTALSNRDKALALAIADMEMLAEITAGFSASGIPADISGQAIRDVVSALNASGTPLQVDDATAARLASEFTAEERKLFRDTEGIFPVEGDEVEALFRSKSAQYQGKSEREIYEAYVAALAERSSGGGGGGGGGRGGGGRRGGRRGGGGGLGYEERANIRIDAYRGLGAGLMTNVDTRPWTPTQNQWRWYQEADNPPLPVYRALGR